MDIQNLDNGQLIPSNEIALTYVGGSATLTAFRTGSAFVDANYHATLSASAVPDLAGNVLAVPSTVDFFVLQGDANRDRHVNALDFNALASNFGRAGATFSQGNFNLDGSVNTADFTVLAVQFNKVLAPPPSPPVMPGLAGSNPAPLFSHHPTNEAKESRDLLAAF